MTSPDGALAPALDRLYATTAKLIDPVKQWAGDRMLVAPSLYQQLVDDVPARTGDWIPSSGYSTPAPPVFVDALDLQREIDDTVKRWCRHGDTTPERLRRIAAGRWRPQDVQHLEHVSAELDRWTHAISALLDPEPVKSVSAACPACGARYVYKQHAGEQVRQPALQLIAETGCTCQACRAYWSPQHYLLLAKVLGIDAPTGVIA